MPKLDTKDNPDTDKLRKLLASMIENQLLERILLKVFSQKYQKQKLSWSTKLKWRRKKTAINKVIEEQLVNIIGSPTTSNNDVEPLAHDIDQPVD